MFWVVSIAAVLVAIALHGVISRHRQQRQFEASARSFNAQIQQQHLTLTGGGTNVALSVLHPADHSYRPVAGEAMLAIHDGVDRLDYRNTGRYESSGTRVSFRLVKGVRFSSGSRRVRAEKTWQATASGRLIVTDKAIVFESAEKNERLTWAQVADIEILLDGYRIAKRSGPPRTFRATNTNARFAAMLNVMLARVG